jgi:Fis family transcriptional regulator
MKNCITAKITKYIESLQGTEVTNIHQLFMQKTEKELIHFFLQKTNNNQTKAAKELGINRATLRKKIQQYNLYNK